MGVFAIVAIVVAVVSAVVLAVGAIVVVRRRRTRTAVPPPPPPAGTSAPKAARPEPAPMTGLEDALNRTTDRSGTTMADRLNAEADAVEGLRVTDDTGPLLRRALDRFGQTDDGVEVAGAAHGEGVAHDPPASDDGGRSETRPPYPAE